MGWFEDRDPAQHPIRQRLAALDAVLTGKAPAAPQETPPALAPMQPVPSHGPDPNAVPPVPLGQAERIGPMPETPMPWNPLAWFDKGFVRRNTGRPDAVPEDRGVALATGRVTPLGIVQSMGLDPGDPANMAVGPVGKVAKGVDAIHAAIGDDIAAAVAKQLGRSEAEVPAVRAAIANAVRMERAKALGFDTEKLWLHGSNRVDRVAEKKGFVAKRANSGPMPFLTDDAEIAGKYATGKLDTSIETPDDYGGWFKFKVGRSNSTVDLDRVWYFLSPEERAHVAEMLPRIGMDEDLRMFTGEPGSNPGGLQHWQWLLKESRGNPLKAAKEEWLNSGNLFGVEEKFLDVLEKAGVKGAIYDSPHMARPGVVGVYAAVKKPLDVNDADAMSSVIPALKDAAKGRRTPRAQYGVDPWDKRLRDPRDWIQRLESGDTMVWTSIPDWVTDRLKTLGFDGIIDKGGKITGNSHNVLIPFYENQLRVPWAKFDPKKAHLRDLLAGVGGAGVAASMANDPDQK